MSSSVSKVTATFGESEPVGMPTALCSCVPAGSTVPSMMPWKLAVPVASVAILRPLVPSALTSQIWPWRSSHSVSAVSGSSCSASQSTYCSVR